jgi:hypothetical protein
MHQAVDLTFAPSPFPIPCRHPGLSLCRPTLKPEHSVAVARERDSRAARRLGRDRPGARKGLRLDGVDARHEALRGDGDGLAHSGRRQRRRTHEPTGLAEDPSLHRQRIEAKCAQYRESRRAPAHVVSGPSLIMRVSPCPTTPLAYHNVIHSAVSNGFKPYQPPTSNVPRPTLFPPRVRRVVVFENPPFVTGRGCATDQSINSWRRKTRLLGNRSAVGSDPGPPPALGRRDRDPLRPRSSDPPGHRGEAVGAAPRNRQPVSARARRRKVHCAKRSRSNRRLVFRRR